MQDSLDSARIAAEYAKEIIEKGDLGWIYQSEEWLKLSHWYLANAIGWASIP